MSSWWGFTWGTPWGSGTEWGARADPRDPDSALVPTQAGDLDTVQTALARLRRQFSSTASWQALARIIGEAFGDVELAMGRCEPQRYVGTAEGVWLGELGTTVGLPREGWTDDDDYRLAIVAEALSQVTGGSVDELIDVVTRIVPEGAAIYYREPAPATAILTVPDLTPLRFALVRSVLADMPPTSVGAFLETYDSTATAGWDYSPDPPATFGSWGYSGGGTDDVLSLWSYAAPIG